MTASNNISSQGFSRFENSAYWVWIGTNRRDPRIQMTGIFGVGGDLKWHYAEDIVTRGKEEQHLRYSHCIEDAQAEKQP